MKHNWVITIGREYCSGGAATGKALSEILGIGYYDKEIVDEAADIAKMDVRTAEKLDEKPVSYLSMASTAMNYPYGRHYYSYDPDLMLPAGIKIANAQSQVIERIAEKESCVIVGRCADQVLGDRPHVFRVFLRADLDVRINRAVCLYKIDESAAKKLIRQTDKIRASYYNGHTKGTWGDPANYDMVLDVGRVGIEKAARIIAQAVQLLDGEDA